MTHHYPDLGSAWTDGLKQISLTAWPIRVTTQTWAAMSHQYGITAPVSQMSFPGETSGGIVNVGCFLRLLIMTLALNTIEPALRKTTTHFHTCTCFFLEASTVLCSDCWAASSLSWSTVVTLLVSLRFFTSSFSIWEVDDLLVEFSLCSLSLILVSSSWLLLSETAILSPMSASSSSTVACLQRKKCEIL